MHLSPKSLLYTLPVLTVTVDARPLGQDDKLEQSCNEGRAREDLVASGIDPATFPLMYQSREDARGSGTEVLRARDINIRTSPIQPPNSASHQDSSTSPTTDSPSPSAPAPESKRKWTSKTLLATATGVAVAWLLLASGHVADKEKQRQKVGAVKAEAAQAARVAAMYEGDTGGGGRVGRIEGVGHWVVPGRAVDG